MNIFMWLDYPGSLPPPAILKPNKLWTGKQILSLVLPPVNYEKGSENIGEPKEDHVLVKKGELLCGKLVKDHVGTKSNNLVHIVWKDLGPDACNQFLSDMQNIINNWLVNHGFTVGVQDIISEPKTNETIKNIINKYKR
jgi:DNA-directed RNA polymerase II subunit RPB1